MPRKTKKEKVSASLRRKRNKSNRRANRTKQKTGQSRGKSTEQKSGKMTGYVKADLRRTFLLSVIAIGIELAAYWTIGQ